MSDVDTLFQVELPAVQRADFTQEDAAHIKQPVFLVVGANSSPSFDFFRQTNDQLQAWLPQSESYTLPDADHLLMLRNPRDMARALASFFSRHAVESG